MLTLIAPAKTVDLKNAPRCKIKTKTEPQLLDETIVLTDILKSKSIDQLFRILDCSYAMAEDAKIFYDKFEKNTKAMKGKHAIALMDDFVRGVDLTTWKPKDFEFVQEHLGIISSLYGFLRPFDIIGSYLLPQDTILHTPKGRRVIEYWKGILTEFLKKYLESKQETVIVSLLTSVARRQIDWKQINATVYDVSFIEIAKTGNVHTTSSWRLNRLRANLIEYIAQKRINDIEDLKKFSFEGFEYSPDSSQDNTIAFTKF